MRVRPLGRERTRCGAPRGVGPVGLRGNRLDDGIAGGAEDRSHADRERLPLRRREPRDRESFVEGCCDAVAVQGDVRSPTPEGYATPVGEENREPQTVRVVRLEVHLPAREGDLQRANGVSARALGGEPRGRVDGDDGIGRQSEGHPVGRLDRRISIGRSANGATRSSIDVPSRCGGEISPFDADGERSLEALVPAPLRALEAPRRKRAAIPPSLHRTLAANPTCVFTPPCVRDSARPLNDDDRGPVENRQCAYCLERDESSARVRKGRTVEKKREKLASTERAARRVRLAVRVDEGAGYGDCTRVPRLRSMSHVTVRKMV